MLYSTDVSGLALLGFFDGVRIYPAIVIDAATT
jgi:hypothetical protein